MGHPRRRPVLDTLIVLTRPDAVKGRRSVTVQAEGVIFTTEDTEATESMIVSLRSLRSLWSYLLRV